LFISYAQTRYKFNTIKSTMSALIDWHTSKEADYSAITCKETKLLLATVQSKQGPAGLPAGKQGLSKPMLRLLIHYLKTQRKRYPAMATIMLRDECVILLGFYGMMRRSEIVALTIEDVRIGTHKGARYVEVHIKRSKTDRGRVGATVTITGVTQDGLDIAGAIEEYCHLRAERMPDPTSPFITKWDLDALECHASVGVTGQALALRLQKHLLAIKRKYPAVKVNPHSYAMHSLRRGGVTAAWEAGVDIAKIKAHGRWRSDAVRAYMQATRPIRLMVTSLM
jgi:integrase